jgi:ribonuclease VapC
MLVDTSVWIAILFREAGNEKFVETLRTSPNRYITAPGLLEATMVAVSKLGDSGDQELRALLDHTNVNVLPFGREAAEIARRAYLAFGKGRNHPAQLNFGDCISYAVSKAEVMPLLFEGNDFRLTDVECAA